MTKNLTNVNFFAGVPKVARHWLLLSYHHHLSMSTTRRLTLDEAAVGIMRRLEHSQKEIVLKERDKLLAWNTVRKR